MTAPEAGFASRPSLCAVALRRVLLRNKDELGGLESPW
jgi:hypothetical protein